MNKKPIDYYDRIADALEIISGDNSHINDEDKNMDYYDRIANALEVISENPITAYEMAVAGGYTGTREQFETDIGNSATNATNAANSAASIAASAAQIQTNTGDIADLKTQINQRGIPSGGSTGQSLRKKSGTNYDMEWADVGLPTDEQTADAVSAWLDEHPEATTTVDFQIVDKIFETVDAMVQDLTLSIGDKVKTNGYYINNDGGGAYYYIRGVESGDNYSHLVDGTTSKDGLIRISNSGTPLVAELIYNNAITVDMFGMTSGSDLTDHISDYVYYCQKIKQPITFKCGGRYNTSGVIDLTGYDISIIGNESVITATDNMDAVIIYSYGSTAMHTREINNLTLECDGKAKTGLWIKSAAGLPVNNLLVLNPVENGVYISGGYEVSITNLTVHNRLYTLSSYEGIGLWLATSDCFIKNVVTINMHIGMLVSGGGNMINSFHPWVSGAYPNVFSNSYGLINRAMANIYDGCYFDTCRIGASSSRQITFTNCVFLIGNSMYQYLDSNPVFIQANDDGGGSKDAIIYAKDCYFENATDKTYNPYIRHGEHDPGGSSVIIISALKSNPLYSADTFKSFESYSLKRYGLVVSNLDISPHSVEAKDYSINCDYRDMAMFQSQNGVPDGVIMSAYLVSDRVKLRFYNTTDAKVTVNDRVYCTFVRGEIDNTYIDYETVNPMYL